MFASLLLASLGCALAQGTEILGCQTSLVERKKDVQAYIFNGTALSQTTVGYATLVEFHYYSSPPLQSGESYTPWIGVFTGAGYETNLSGTVMTAHASGQPDEPVYVVNVNPGTKIKLVNPARVIFGLTRVAAVVNPNPPPDFLMVTTNDQVGKTIETFTSNCEAQSIDNRFTFGIPNTEGVIQPDPNALEQHVLFRPWEYRGGIFVGNAPVTGKDRSGIGRLQIKVTSPPSAANVAVATLVLADSGMFKNGPTSLTLGLFSPASNDPNLNLAFSALKWNTRWTSINPRPNVPPPNPPDPPEPFDPSQDPISKFSPSNATSPLAPPTLANFPVAYYFHTEISESAGGTVVPNNDILSRLAIALHAESYMLGSSTWRYFVSEWPPLPASYPIAVVERPARLIYVKLPSFWTNHGYAFTFPQ